eukprot:CAMPEP_0167788608 /NCGR_PEP_ID=MMETSP0111_2-20121227/10143_1 /TAXON_ID=91324 /ORGANISM="Lotharella globosa, Strain CCCM811" /LENGTH=206 /DNA_ID=CAMNT_0007680521 /DNA_START=304 /DNA_END=924 /DNA_ORIENTATION=+
MAHTFASGASLSHAQRQALRVCAEEDDFEKRMDKISSAGRRMTGTENVATEKPKAASFSKKSNPYEKKTYDFSNEKTFYEGPPHRGDAVVNTVLGASLVWLPLTVASLTRAVSINYVITDQRVSVITKAPWAENATRIDAPYDQIKKVESVPRGIGLWGDMAVTTVDNNVLEFRSLDNFREIQKYVRENMPQQDNDDFGEEDYVSY